MADTTPDATDPNPLGSNNGAGSGGFNLNSVLNDPTMMTFLSMIGSSQAPGPAFAGGLQDALKARQANNQNQMQQMQLAQLKARQNLNPSQFLLSNQQHQAPTQAAGPATLAALAGQQGPQAAQQIAGNTQTPYQPPPGAIGNVDMQGLLGATQKAGMSPEEAQQMAGVLDPMTAMRMRLMSQPAVSVAPGASLVSPGAAQLSQMSGAAPAAGSQPGALFTNNNLPPDSQAAQVMNLTKARDAYAPNGPTPDPAKYASMDAALNKANGTFDQQMQATRLADLQQNRDFQHGMAVQNQQLIQNQRNVENNFHVQQQAQGLQASVEKMGIPQTDQSLQKMEDLLAKYPSGQLPGFGKVDNTMANHGMSFLMSQEAQSVRQQMQPLINMQLHARNGARITPPEVQRIQAEMGTGDYVSEDRLRQGVANMRTLLNSQKANLAAGTPSNVLDQYEAAGGVPLPRGAAAPAQQPAPAQIAPNDALAELRRRGVLK